MKILSRLKTVSAYNYITEPKEIENLLKKAEVENYTINSDGTIDINGDFRFADYLDFLLDKNGHLKIKFNKVSSFDVMSKLLSTCEGFPKTAKQVTINDCEKLLDLVGVPTQVETFGCGGCNHLKSLKGAPEKVGKVFSCSHCENLKSLKGAPRIIGDYVSLYGCENLQSLDGLPECEMIGVPEHLKMEQKNLPKEQPKIEIVEELGKENAPGYNGLLNLVKQNNVFYCYFPEEGIEFIEGKTPEKAIENFFKAIIKENGTQDSISYFENFEFYDGKYSSKLENLFYKKFSKYL